MTIVVNIGDWKGSTGATFSCLNNNKHEATYWKDKNSLFVDDSQNKQLLIKLDGADVNTFKADIDFWRDNIWLLSSFDPVK